MFGGTVGVYRIQQLLASGGTGRVFLGVDAAAVVRVAVKVPVDDTPASSGILARESRLLAEFTGQTPAIVSWRCHELDAHPPWFAMEHVEGISLSRWIRKLHESTSTPLFQRSDRRAFDDSLDLVAKLASALAVIHERGVIHGDLTPKNVLVRRDGTPVIIDFGSAFRDPSVLRVRDQVREAWPTYGTPGYIAPEVDVGNPGDARRDLYALGCLLWHALSGAAPRARPKTDVERGSVPEPLRELLARLLEPNPEHRVASAREVETILSQLRGVDAPSEGKLRRAPLPRAKTVGREGPATELRARLESARMGRGSATLLLGEAGIGKTRLVNDTIAEAQRALFQVLCASCPDVAETRAAGALPAIQSALEQGGLSTREAATPAPAAPEVDRARRLDSLFETLIAASTRAPVLLVLDDLHWADELTLAFARSERLTKIAQVPICILGSYRTKELHIVDQRSFDSTTWSHLELPPLTLDDVRAVAKSLLGSKPFPEGLDDWLHETTGGNPLYVTECVRDLARSRLSTPASCKPDAGEARSLFSGIPRGWVPRTLMDVITTRLDSLSRPARYCARVAGILGDEFSVNELLGPVHALWPELDVAAALEELRAVHVLELSEPTRYRFTHNLYARGSLHPVAELDEAQLSAGLAHYYERCGSATRTSREVARLGRLHAQAGSSTSAFGYLSEAAGLAHDANQLSIARRLYGEALEQFELLTQEPRSKSAAAASSAHTALADLLHREARYTEADWHYEAALALGGSELENVERASLLRKRARALRAPNRYDAATEIIAAAQRELGRCPESGRFWSEWIEVEIARFWLAYYARKPFGGLLEALEPIVLERGTKLQQCDFYQCACASLLAANRYAGCEDATRYAARALEAIRSSPEHRDRVPDAFMVAGFPLLWRGRPEWQQAIALIEEAERGAAWMDDLTLLAQARTYLALAHRRCGHVDEADAAARAAFATADRTDSRGYRGASLASSTWVAWKSGDLDQVDRLARDARRWWRNGALRHPFQSFLNLVWADALRVHERFPEAKALLTELLAPDLQRLPDDLQDAIVAATAPDESSETARATDLALMNVTRVALRLGYL